MVKYDKHLNLDSEFKMSDNLEQSKSISYQRFTFPSKIEPHIKITTLLSSFDKVLIVSRIKSLDDLMLIFLATDALRRMGIKSIGLFLPYLPFARQDRVMVDGEPLSIKVISDLINIQNYNDVFLYDTHSDVSGALINNSKVISNFSLVEKTIKRQIGLGITPVLVSPDAGSYKKVFKLAQELQIEDMITCSKVRDVSNGKIKKIIIDNHELISGRDLYIIDDICDGGGTFVMLGEELQKYNALSVNLIVSHGIFSKGIDLQYIDRIYTTDSFRTITTEENKNNNLTQEKLCQII